MVQIVRRVVIPELPRDVVFRAVEIVAETLVADAKKNIKNSKTNLRANEKNGYVESFIQFFPYKYDFIWRIEKARGGYEVTLDARTQGKWYESFLDVVPKMDNLVNTQWSALLNFSIGFITAKTYKKTGAREKIAGAREMIEKTRGEVRVKGKGNA